ncbi:LytTR family DNA-binding domain-containing protein [Sphingosinicella sp. BN140058]|uniref:LytTR family DNA-binding domain-containing protein n=1 Tax=Sphingosinicella sp. BN140058 TaxID=1892855 RepID=UPI0010103C4E|nr:LytTR family DNA-binding domain-containing protein [Sphingosinicella sp. BN140058]QAY75327.1 LytTR family transcriptional regulator [Sphingosinicella sp. BN140058]
MSGDVTGTNGEGPGAGGSDGVTSGVPAAAFLLCAAAPILFAGLNVWTRLHDQPVLVAAGRTWEVVAWEVSSAAVTILLLPFVARIAYRAVAALPGIGRALALHLAGIVAFFLLHVGGFVLIRSAVYAAMGSRYRFGGFGAWLYELPKDAVSYAILAAVMTVALLRPRTSAPIPEAPDAPPAAIPIREGSRTHYARPDEILAVSSAGNYVEWHLEDGRKPLTRASLAAIEAQLAPLGFIRTHRSWLVNRRRVTAIAATRSGDHQLTLAGGVTVPGSRRYAAALETL